MRAQAHLEVWMGHRVQTAWRGGARTIPNTTITPGLLDELLSERCGFGTASYCEIFGESQVIRGTNHRQVLVTFDDGYRDILTEALPILERHRVYTILFLTTGFIDGELVPYELVLLRYLHVLHAVTTPDGATFSLAVPGERQRVYEKLRLRIKSATAKGRQDFLNELTQINGQPLPEITKDEFLTWDDVRELDRHPLVTIGAHSCTHIALPAVPKGEAYREVRDSKREIEEEVAHTIDCFAYPYGEHSRVVRRIAKSAGFRFAFTTGPGRSIMQRLGKWLALSRAPTKPTSAIKRGQWIDPFAIPRIDLNSNYFPGIPREDGCVGG